MCQVSDSKEPDKSKGKKKVDDKLPPELFLDVPIVMPDEVPEDAVPHPVELVRRLAAGSLNDAPEPLERQEERNRFIKSEMDRIAKLVEPYGDEGEYHHLTSTSFLPCNQVFTSSLSPCLSFLILCFYSCCLDKYLFSSMSSAL